MQLSLPVRRIRCTFSSAHSWEALVPRPHTDLFATPLERNHCSLNDRHLADLSDGFGVTSLKAERLLSANSVEKLPTSVLSDVFGGTLPLPGCEIVDPMAI